MKEATTHIQPQGVKSLVDNIEQLRLPSRPTQDLAIIGGGVAGLSVAKEGLDLVCANSQAATPSFGVGPINRMSLLVGGDSLAYSPVQGSFSDLLTLFGTEKFPRAQALDTYRGVIEERFRDLSFHFDRGMRATKVTRNTSGTFRVETSCNGESSFFDSHKLVLALGHSMREVPQELRNYIVRGAGDLCTRLAKELPHSSCQEECLERLLQSRQRYHGETFRIGLVGMGASMIEVVKVLERFLFKSPAPDGRYHTWGSQTPVELVVYDPRIGNRGTVLDGFCKLAEDSILSLNVAARSQDVYDFWNDTARRLMRFVSSQQMIAVPHRVDWERVDIVDGFVVPSTLAPSDPQPLSILIDCAPFIEGVGKDQYAVLEGLDVVNCQPLSPSVWRVVRDEDACRGRLAFAGAVVIPRSQWSAPSIEAQAKEIMTEFYGLSA